MQFLGILQEAQYVRQFASLQKGKETLARVMVDPAPNVKEAVRATITNCSQMDHPVAVEPSPAVRPPLSPVQEEIPHTAPAKDRSGVLHYYGSPVALGGTVVFDNLPEARLKFTYDHSGWQLIIKHNQDGTKWVTMISIKHGFQTRCDLGWEIVE